MEIDRTVAPVINSIEQIKLGSYKSHKLSNGLPITFVNGGSQEVVGIELVFSLQNVTSPEIALGTAQLLKEGTNSKSGKEISNIIDFYGAFLEISSNKDFITVALYSLNKHLSKVLPLLLEVMAEPTFPVEEIENFVNRKIEKLKVMLSKNDVVCKREFNKTLFTKNHFYGKNSSIEGYYGLTREQLLENHKQIITINNCHAFIAGMVSDEILQQLENILGSWNHKVAISNSIGNVEAQIPRKIFLEREDALQSAIRIGKIVIDKSNPDFIPLQITNVVLGGYFGSRLMSNIREDKGYTYGIGSFILSQKQACYFCISTEVGADVTQAALTEIYNEIETLRTELVSVEELELMRSYLLGEVIKSVDGPFALLEKWKGLILSDLSEEYFNQLVDGIKTVTPEVIKEMAIKYLDPSTLTEVVVGKK